MISVNNTANGSILSIKNIAQTLVKNAELVEEWLSVHHSGKKILSFDQDAEAEFPSTKDDPRVEEARISIIESTEILRDLLRGPGEVLRGVCWGSIDNSVQQCIYRHGILNKIPLDGGVTYEELAKQTSLPDPQLKAIVRQSAMNRILCEDVPNEHVVHTASSALLLHNKAMMDWYGHCVEEMFPAGAKLGEALSATSPHDSSAFNLAFNTQDPIYTFFEKNPERQARFFGAMEGVGRDWGHSLEHVVNGYPWRELGENVTVVDVGGSSGFMSVALAQAHPNLSKVVVEDYQHTIEQGAAQLPKELANRVQFQAHDFFKPQPVHGADVYILRHICHNWSTANSAKILKELVSVMKPTSKILLVEVVVKPSGMEDSTIAERYMRNVDVTMLQMLNTQERSKVEWEQVVEATDPRLELTRVFKPKGSWDSIVEVSFKKVGNKF